MVANTPVTCHDRTVALLREVDPDLAETVDAVRPSTDGEVMVGLLGWLPRPERLRLCRAVVLAHPPGGDCDWEPVDYYDLAHEMADSPAAWRNPLTDECRARRDAGIRTWTALGHPPPRLNAD